MWRGQVIKDHLFCPDAGKQQELRTYLNSVKKQDLDTQESNRKIMERVQSAPWGKAASLTAAESYLGTQNRAWLQVLQTSSETA